VALCSTALQYALQHRHGIMTAGRQSRFSRGIVWSRLPESLWSITVASPHCPELFPEELSLALRLGDRNVACSRTTDTNTTQVQNNVTAFVIKLLPGCCVYNKQAYEWVRGSLMLKHS